MGGEDSAEVARETSRGQEVEGDVVGGSGSSHRVPLGQAVDAGGDGLALATPV